MGKKKEHHEEHVDETWLIPYADMLTLLLALFIVMFAMSKVDAEKMAKVSASFNNVFMGGTSVLEKGNSGTSTEGTPSIVSDGQIEQETMDKIMSQIKSNIDARGYADKVEVSVNEVGLEINIKDVILFDSAKADIKSEINPLLLEISQILKGLNNNIKIIGYTDNRPIHNNEFRSNWDLSAIRAINVMQFISQQGGIPQDKLSIEAYGEYRPKYDNLTEEGRAGNRRVEITILRNFPVEKAENKAN
ncbi:flagellar motor protein MotB [Clostridium carnis]